MSGFPDRLRSADQRYYGVYIGLVVENADPRHMGRVRLSLPWYNATMVTEWCRVVQPYAGKGHGFYWVPEIDSEVLVAFEQGAIDWPVVTGALYSGMDTPPFHRNGSDPKYFQTKAGHRILMEDSSGSQKIEIVDSSGNNSIVIDTATDAITITANGDITIEAKGTLKLVGSKSLEVKSEGGVTVKGQTIDLN